MTTNTVMMLNTKDYHGVDVDLDISLREYGILVANVPDICNEHHVIYGIDYDTENDMRWCKFDSKFVSEADVDRKLHELDTIGFLTTQGCDAPSWLSLPLVHKIHSLIRYYGYADVMGVSYQEPVAIQLI